MKRFMTIVTSALVFGMATPSLAEDICSKYYGKGYCTDYIKKKVGTKQGGDAKDWSCNVDKTDVKGGDVAIFKSKNHVALVEEVTRDKKGKPKNIRISEWNWGKINKKDKEKKYCIVTESFGISNERSVSASSGVCFWRP